MPNPKYTAYKVLKLFCAEKGYTINSFTFPNACVKKSMVWVDENADGVTRLFCKMLTPTTAIIIAFDTLYSMVYISAKDYTDNNTPPIVTD